MRVPWTPRFPPVFVHSAWDAPADRVLPDHTGYFPAKKRRDARAALAVCEDLCQEETVVKLYDACFTDHGTPPPIVVAPAMSLGESQNYLAIGYASWLANEMGWPIATGIFQAQTASRDFVTDGWFRLVHQPQFYGDVEAGRRYVIADDVCTMGGTIASLRSFIESKGGSVICTTALASRNGSDVQISLAQPTLTGLSGYHGSQLAAVCLEELGYGVECLTEPEGRFLLRCPNLDALRAGINGTRNA